MSAPSRVRACLLIVPAAAAAASLSLGLSGCGGGTAHAGPGSTTTAPPASRLPPAARSAAAPAGAPRPRIVSRFIPFPSRRRTEMTAYARRHYRSFLHPPTYRLEHPQVIVEHFTETATFQAAFNTFASDQADRELHEKPGTCAHFVIDHDGTIYQLVQLRVMCRHTVGLNWTAIGIEHVAFTDGQILGNPRQLRSSLELTRWLRCRFHITLENVIGHNESLGSPFHHEDVVRLRHQTHNDLKRASMRAYRTRLAKLPCA